jgi:hypothetical protein
VRGDGGCTAPPATTACSCACCSTKARWGRPAS